ncbi:unnamed protein product [Diamesa hyperborea]
MAEDILSHNHRAPYKTRSSSISAPPSSSLEAIICQQPIDNGNNSENSTPDYRRRKPAARSQSARITGVRSVRKKVPQIQQNLNEVKSQFTSEPYLADENDTPPQPVRKGSQRRPNASASVYSPGRRKSNAFLDVPGNNSNFLRVNDGDDDITIRTFSSSNKGIVNRGDSFRRRRSRSSSLVPPSSPMRPKAEEVNTQSSGRSDSYLVAMLGAPGVGKAALLSQFQSSEGIDYGESDCPGEENISIILDGMESELKFITDSKGDKDQIDGCDAFLVIYSVVDKASFTRAEYFLTLLHDLDLLKSRCCILIGNKIDLARSRAVSSQDGKCMACTYRVKFIEVSVGINHNIDELLAGTLTQIRLKKEHCELQGIKESSHHPHWYKNRNVVRASMKARQMITWMFGKEDSKFRNCENLQIL